MFDRFFDMMNTRPDLAPYKLANAEDRLKVNIIDYYT